MLEVFPEADIYTSVFFMQDNPLFKNKKVITSFIQKIPIFNKYHKLALIFRPKAFESFDFSDYDIVISSSTAESKWIITKPNTIHICYCHTPTRYFWSHYHEYMSMMEFWLLNPIWRWLMPKIVQKLRVLDFIASKRVDYFIANSKNTSNRIKKYYKADSEVIYPWIDTTKFYLSQKKDYYLYVWRVIPYKKFDLVVDTFNNNWKKLIICTNTPNRLQKFLQSISKENITWVLNPSKKDLNKYYSEAKAFLFPPEEDFWLVPIEAMASWTPVIAYKKWWALETVIDWETWIFFKYQTVQSLNDAIYEFEKKQFDSKKIREYALLYDKEIFKKKLLEFVNKIT